MCRSKNVNGGAVLKCCGCDGRMAGECGMRGWLPGGFTAAAAADDGDDSDDDYGV